MLSTAIALIRIVYSRRTRLQGTVVLFLFSLHICSVFVYLAVRYKSARHTPYFFWECAQFNSPCFLVSYRLQIRVVNAFRQGLDARYGEHSNTSLAEILRKQTSLPKRLSQTSSIEYADNIPDELTIPEIDVERLSSHSHTETAV